MAFKGGCVILKPICVAYQRGPNQIKMFHFLHFWKPPLCSKPAGLNTSASHAIKSYSGLFTPCHSNSGHFVIWSGIGTWAPAHFIFLASRRMPLFHQQKVGASAELVLDPVAVWFSLWTFEKQRTGLFFHGLRATTQLCNCITAYRSCS